jgi:hypothetical protein
VVLVEVMEEPEAEAAVLLIQALEALVALG